MSLTNSPFWMAQAGGASFYDYEIENSFRLDKDADHYLSRTPASAGNRQKWTLSWWMKRGKIYDGQTLFAWGNFSQNFIFTISGYAGDNSFDYYDYDNGTDRSSVSWSYKVRDSSAWYHMVLRVDTTEATASNRVRLYINNQQASDSGGRTNYPSQNISMFANNNTPTYIAHDFYGGRGDGYYADVNFIDGQSLDPTSFAETKSGVWVPKEYTGSYGTNGYFLKFQNSAALGTDSSGNANNFTVNNATAHDQMPDTPTNNFPTIIKGYNQNITQGNLKVERSSNANNHMGYFSTMGMKTGKWYAEVRYVDTGIDTVTFGVAETNERFSPSQDLTAYAGGSRGGIAANTYVDWATYSVESKKFSTYNGTNTSYGVGGASGDIFMLAVDMDNNKFWIGKNGTWMASGNPAAGTNPTHEGAAFAPETEMVFVGSFYAGRATDIRWNFGQDSTFMGAITAGNNADANGYGDFKYAPPSGFLALCSANLPAPAIDPAEDASPTDYFNTVLYAGNGNTGQSITGVGFQPDFLWIKNRNMAGGYPHLVRDVVRGVTKRLRTNSTDAEETANTVSSFDSDGFTLAAGQGNSFENDSAGNYVSWNWKAGGTAVTNNDGSQSCSVSANADSGFSVVKWTASAASGTLGHGLSTAPDLIIAKPLASSNWFVQCRYGMTAAQVMNLESTSAAYTPGYAHFQSTLPTSSVFYYGGYLGNGFAGTDKVAYCFSSVDGYCKVGSYTGNGSTDGGFIYTGFKPAFLICKNYNTSSHHWTMTSNKIPEYNVINKYLYANSTGTEMTGDRVDFLADGFKLRHGDWDNNRGGVGYIYIAFAENPFKYANAR